MKFSQIIVLLFFLLSGVCGECLAQGQVSRPGKQTTTPAKQKPATPTKRGASTASTRSFDGERAIGGIKYRFNSSSLTCEVIKGSYSGNIVIPSTVNFNGHKYKVTKIAASAFSECRALKSVSIPSTITEIGENAFFYCYNIEKLEFAGIESMCNIKFGNEFSNTFYYNNKLYINGKEIRQLVIPEGVTSIGAYTFCNCSSLTSVTIPNSVTSIGNYAFEECSGITSVSIPNSVISIGDGAFKGCSGISSVHIPNSVTSIGNGAFKNCKGLISLTISNSVTSIENGTFQSCSSLTSVNIPGSVKSIGDFAFSYCSNLSSVSIPNSVTSIGNEAFDDCYSLTTVIIPNSVTTLGNSAFYGCRALTSVSIPNSVTSIGNMAFLACRKLTNVRFEAGSSAILIAKDAFERTPVENKINELVQGKRRLKD